MPKHLELRESLFSFKELLEANLPEPPWIIEGWLVKGAPGIIAGRPKTFKSTMAMDMAMSVASGNPYLGQFEVKEQGPVVYVMEENNAPSVRSLMVDLAWAKGLGTPSGVTNADGDVEGYSWGGPDLPLYTFIRPGFKLEDDWVDALLEFCIKVDAKMVVLDAWYRVLPGGVEANQGKDMGPIFDLIQRFVKADPTITVLTVAHTNKSGDKISEAGGLSIMGTTYVEAFFETLIINYPDDGGNAAKGVINTKRFFRDKPPQPHQTIRLADSQSRRAGWAVEDYKGKAGGQKQVDEKEKKYQGFKANMDSGKFEGWNYSKIADFMSYKSKSSVGDFMKRYREESGIEPDLSGL